MNTNTQTHTCTCTRVLLYLSEPFNSLKLSKRVHIPIACIYHPIMYSPLRH